MKQRKWDKKKKALPGNLHKFRIICAKSMRRWVFCLSAWYSSAACSSSCWQRRGSSSIRCPVPLCPTKTRALSWWISDCPTVHRCRVRNPSSSSWKPRWRKFPGSVTSCPLTGRFRDRFFLCGLFECLRACSSPAVSERLCIPDVKYDASLLRRLRLAGGRSSSSQSSPTYSSAVTSAEPAMRGCLEAFGSCLLVFAERRVPDDVHVRVYTILSYNTVT